MIVHDNILFLFFLFFFWLGVLDFSNVAGAAFYRSQNAQNKRRKSEYESWLDQPWYNNIIIYIYILHATSLSPRYP